MNNLIYNLYNLAGILLIGFGFGLIRIPYGLIAAGAVLIGLSIYNDRTLRAK